MWFVCLPVFFFEKYSNGFIAGVIVFGSEILSDFLPFIKCFFDFTEFLEEICDDFWFLNVEVRISHRREDFIVEFTAVDIFVRFKEFRQAECVSVLHENQNECVVHESHEFAESDIRSLRGKAVRWFHEGNFLIPLALELLVIVFVASFLEEINQHFKCVFFTCFWAIPVLLK